MPSAVDNSAASSLIWRAALREGAWRQAEARSLLGAKGDGCERGRTDEEDDGEVELE